MKPDIRDTPCPLHHAEGRKACAVVFDVGGDSEGAFCEPRLIAALEAQARALSPVGTAPACAEVVHANGRCSRPDCASPAGTAVPMNATLAPGQDPWELSRGVGTAVPEVAWTKEDEARARLRRAEVLLRQIESDMMLRADVLAEVRAFIDAGPVEAAPEVCGTCHGHAKVFPSVCSVECKRNGHPLTPCPACSPGGERTP